MERRVLAETLVDLASAVVAAMPAGSPVRARRLELALPLEVRLAQQNGEASFLGELPLCRWRTDFDLLPSQMRIVWTTSEL